MFNNFLRLVSDDEIMQIRNAAEKLFCKRGVVIKSDYILDKCEQKGLKVDRAKSWVQCTPELFRILEERARASATGLSSELISRRYGPYDKANQSEVIRRPLPAGMKLGRNIASVYDYKTKTKKLATLADNNEMAKAMQMLSDVQACAPLWVSNDLPAQIEPVVSAAETMKISDKPFAEVELMMPGQFEFLEELHTIQSGKQVKINHYFASMANFGLDENTSKLVEEMDKKNGLKLWGSNSVPILGVNCPYTIAAGCVHGMAEMFAGWVVGWVLNEEIILNSVPVSASFDMKTSNTLFSSPEATLVDATLYQIYNVLYNMSVHPENSATYVDGKVPGHQVIHDKVWKSMTMFAYTGCDVGSHYGYLEAGSSICPAQLILDFDIDNNMHKMARGLDVNEDTLALDVMEELGIDGMYLGDDHTIMHLRDMWIPNVMDRSGYTSDAEEAEQDAKLYEKAQAKFDAALSSYSQPDISEEKIKAYDEVIKKAYETLNK